MTRARWRRGAGRGRGGDEEQEEEEEEEEVRGRERERVTPLVPFGETCVTHAPTTTRNEGFASPGPRHVSRGFDKQCNNDK